MNKSNPLLAIGPIDGRYNKQTIELQDYFSEYALIKYRIMVEILYFKRLCGILPQLKFITDVQIARLERVAKNFSVKDAQVVKDFEKTTNHDVKAVEYFIKSKFDTLGLSAYKEFVHFGLTSQDATNPALTWMMKDATEKVYKSFLDAVIKILDVYSLEWRDISMLAHTHGQPASPTRLGKEISVFSERLIIARELLEAVPFTTKFGGATGNFNAHHVAYPGVDWKKFADEFVAIDLGVRRQQNTTQIEHYDNVAAWCDAIKRINTILIDLCRDMWTYISMDYFKQKIKEKEVGSSAMPHKVNPIDFENAEGNLGMANTLFEHFAIKLPISRLQRDLTDSTVTRNLGVPMAHTVIALNSLLKGLGKLMLNKEAIDRDLENNWAVVTEAIQTILRREGVKQPYEMLKEIARTNEKIDERAIRTFIQSLYVKHIITKEVEEELLAITPFNYTGI